MRTIQTYQIKVGGRERAHSKWEKMWTIISYLDCRVQ
jgi:hypothetical protein